MTEYEKNLPPMAALPPPVIDYPLAAVLVMHDLRQLHIGETEKYAHVTYFLNGGKELPFATYNEKPEMSAGEITDYVVSELNEGSYDVYIINLANAAMVAHIGDNEATKLAIETLDSNLKKITNLVRSLGGAVIITEDHGNAESMINPTTGGPNTSHTANPVSFIAVCDKFSGGQNLKPLLVHW